MLVPLDRETDAEAVETRDWLDSLEDVLATAGPERVRALIGRLQVHAQQKGVRLPFTANTPYINTIPADQQPPYPGNRELEWRIKSLVRWNAMAMVVRANRADATIGGHISTFASAATLYEVAFNHFFRGRSDDHSGDKVYFQGHAAPGVYARAFLEGRLSQEQLENFRHELRPTGGLSSYPHPWLMPDFWQFPTVSMGLSSIMAIYHARFVRYLEDRGLKQRDDAKIWAFLGDGETDEPESLGAITLASREGLDNLIFVINCNLQRLDGPVRGNGKIVQELEASFRGAGWNVIKVLWGDDWDPLLAKDDDGLLVRRMGEVVDGEYQKYVVESGAYIREHFFGANRHLKERVAHLSDEKLRKMRRGGHDPEKVYAAYKAAVEHIGAPTVILAKTIKGYGLGEVGEGKNVTHQQKKLNEDELRAFRTRFGIPISDDEVGAAPFYRPPDSSPEIQYLRERRKALGGSVPKRSTTAVSVPRIAPALFEEFHAGTDDREASTTMVLVRMLSKLLKDPGVGKLIVPIVPDEARTFGMETLFRQCGIYSAVGQLYEPVDRENLLYYREAKDGQILEEGITEGGSMSSFIAAGTAYSVHGIPTIPFFIFYSMFGLQRIGDLVWAAGDARTRGFLCGATSGRTTLNGEGLQHQDGHSHLLAWPVPNLVTYDPAYAYELAVIVEDGIRRMYVEGEDVFYYVTVMNESYAMPPMPPGAREGILKGIYKFRGPAAMGVTPRVHLLGSGTILNAALEAQRLLADRWNVASDVWSVTSYKELRRDAIATEHRNLMHPEEPRQACFLERAVSGCSGVFVAASDYVKALPDSIARWLPGPLTALGTDGWGRSESRNVLRDFFEVDARWIAYSALVALARRGEIDAGIPIAARAALGIDPTKADPATL